MVNLNLFNESTPESLLSYITLNASECAEKFPHKKWIFYAMTCYFNQDTAKVLATSLTDILGRNLLGFHVLVDKNDWLKQCIYINDFVENICQSKILEKHQVSFTPINANGKLFHAKSYALISLPFEVSTSNPKIVLDNVDLSQNTDRLDRLNGLKKILFSNNERIHGFVNITSGNFTQSGFNSNIEIGCFCYDELVLHSYTKLFHEIQVKYAVSQEEIDKKKEFQIAIHTLSLGTFYHKWERSFDLRFRLKLSQEEIKRLQEESKKNKEIYGEYTPDERKSISINPINIESIFEQFPKPIPPAVWAIYSIETIFGQWVPCEISDLIEEEIDQSILLCYQMIQELTSPPKMDEYVNKLQQDVNKFLEKEVIEADSDNLSAISSWKEKINKICNDTDTLKLFISKYEKVDISLQKLDRKTILDIYNRIKSFVNINNLNRGIAKTWEDLEIKDNYKYNYNLFDTHLQSVKDLLLKNRRGELNNRKPQDEFFATFIKGNNLIHGVYLQTDNDKINYINQITEKEEFFF